MSDRKIHAVLVLPPPMTGQTIVSRKMVEHVLPETRLCLSAISGSGLFWRIRKHLLSARATFRAANLSQGRDDLYIVPDSGHGLLINAFVLSWVRKSFRRVYFHHHGMSALRQPNQVWRLLISILGKRDRHIALGASMKKALANGLHVPDSSILSIGNAAFVQKPIGVDDPTECLTVGFLGNITMAKGILAFCETVDCLQAEGIPVKAIIAGPISEKRAGRVVSDFCQERPLERSYVGRVDEAQKVAFLANIDVLLFPSMYRNEAAPLTVLEAISSGRPVLATNTSTGNLALHPEWSFASKFFVSQASTKLRHWFTNPDAFRKEVKNAKRYWRKNYEHGLASLDRGRHEFS